MTNRTMSFDKIKQYSPYSVVVVSPFSIVGYNGVFRHPSGTIGQEKIEIADNLSKKQTIATLIHEIIHAKHHKRKCKCYEKGFDATVLRELHAYKVEIAYCMRYHLDSELKKVISSIRDNAFDGLNYQAMAKQIKHEKIYKKALAYLSEKT